MVWTVLKVIAQTYQVVALVKNHQTVDARIGLTHFPTACNGKMAEGDMYHASAKPCQQGLGPCRRRDIYGTWGLEWRSCQASLPVN